MRVHSRKLNEGETFLCSKAALDRALPRDLIEWISFAGIGQTFDVERRFSRRPELEGPVVLAATAMESRQAYICLYPIKEDQLTPDARDQFATLVLPKVAAWITRMASRDEIALTNYETLIVEWTGADFHIQQLRRRFS